MIHSISHRLYQQIILLYPEPFRREFGEEMLSDFDECQASQGTPHLLADGLVAALKQQLRYLTIRAPQRTALYVEIALSPVLARALATAVIGVAIIAGVFAPEERAKTQSWGVVHVEEHQIWYLQCATVPTHPKLSPAKPHHGK